jgi:signal transduction histidine kinase/ActR/RegA family two-component response regulator
MSSTAKLNSGFALALAILIGMSGLSYMSLRAVAKRGHFHETLLAINSLLNTVQDAETGQRGYLLTENDSYLSVFNAAQETYVKKLDDVKAELQDNPVQLKKLETLTSLVHEKMEELQQTVQLRKLKGLKEALQLVSADAPKDQAEVIRQLTTEMVNEQDHLLQKTRDTKDSETSQGITTILFGSAFAFLVIALCAVVINRDLKRRRLVEEDLRAARESALAAVRVKAMFLANMSHEIRTPLNGIIGMTDLLLDTALNETQRKYAKAVQDSGQGLLSIVNDILDFSKIEAGKLTLEVISFNPISVIEGQTDLLSAQAQEKGLAIWTYVDPAIPALLQGDPGRISQILLNLLSNAIKFTAKGSVIIRVTPVHQSSDRHTLRFSVEDTGIGLSPTDQKRLFRPFTQVDASTARQYGGSGLGLSICKHLVEMMGGQIGVDSEYGKGSTFWFTLSLAVTDSVATVQPISTDRSSTRAPSGSARILVAEDNSINQLLVLAQLRSLGYTANAVANGREAVDALSSVPYDLILMDCQMPEVDGFEATKIIRKLEKSTGHHITIIALTANAMKEDQEKCLQCGMDDYLSKPLKREALGRAIERWLSGKYKAVG